ncbi:hypothetical protein ABXN37_00550 [Piscinibacter sakaiensis]|uniref:Uncharacterized protein n=1 Tax=Piscinibacter sakaiensis TaxID=1547922 RepID=A0A0K8NTG2_PISS1|nr:hypothetical protein [Piscinibacter sakaiensis]GAP33662.1 hypothetical protein ISF6_0108 [Piscinibacter sakaiensis]
MTIEVDARTATVRVEIDGHFTPQQVLALVKQLAAARAQLADDPPEPGEVWLAARPPCHTKLMGKGPDTLLAFRFPGLGWIGATLAASMRARLISLLAAQQVQALPQDGAASRGISASAAPAAEPSAAAGTRPDDATLH